MHRAKNFPQVLCTRKKHLSSVNGSHNRFLLLLHLPPHLHPPLLVFLQSTKCAHPEICKISILPQGMHLKKLSKVRLSVYHVVNGQTARKRRCGKRTNEIACHEKGNCKAPDLKSRASLRRVFGRFFGKHDQKCLARQKNRNGEQNAGGKEQSRDQRTNNNN